LRVLIFGAGAVGGALAALLSPANEVDVAVRGRAGAIAKDGITVTGAVERTVRPRTRPDGIYDVIFVTTKAYDTATAAEAVAHHVGEGTAVVSLQNGMGNLELLEARYGDRAMAGLTTMGVTRTGDTTVRLVAKGRTVIGSRAGRTGAAQAVAALLRSAGLDAAASEDIVAEVWMKAVVNAAINPLAALAGGPNSRLLEHPPLLRLSERACIEAARAAEAAGVTLPAPDPFARMKEVLWDTRNNRCSMLQDLEAGRRTEIDEITGALVRRGEEMGVTMAVNRSLWTLMREAEGRPAPDEAEAVRSH